MTEAGVDRIVMRACLRKRRIIVSQQPAVLRNQGIESAQKEGSSVRYALRDPLVGILLDVACRIFDNRLGDSTGLLRELRRETRRG